MAHFLAERAVPDPRQQLGSIVTSWLGAGEASSRGGLEPGRCLDHVHVGGLKGRERDFGGQEAQEEAGEMVLSREGEAHCGVGGEREDLAAAGAGEAEARCCPPARTVQRTDDSSVRDSGCRGVTWQSPRGWSQRVGGDRE